MREREEAVSEGGINKGRKRWREVVGEGRWEVERKGGRDKGTG